MLKNVREIHSAKFNAPCGDYADAVARASASRKKN
jgi:hypothetical protein